MSIKKREMLCILALIILGFAFFYKALYFGFCNLDDPAHTNENIAVLTFDLTGLLFKYYLDLYHPLTTLSFAVDWWLGGGLPWMFHLSNFIFHLLGTLVLFKICLKLWPKKFFLGFLISLTFMLHPLKAESVAWITERKDVLSGLFLWLTIYLYLFYLERKKLWQYLLANLFFLLALAAKVSVAPLPIFLFVIDWYRNRKLELRSLVNKTPFFIMSLIFGLLNVLEQARVNAPFNFPKKNYTDLFYQLHFYIEKFIFPWNLRAWYSPELINFNILGVASVALICFLTVFIIKIEGSVKQRKDIVLGWSLFILFLFPNIKIITPHDANIVNDRYMYIALTGLTFAFFPFILHLIEYLWNHRRRVFSLALSGAFATIMLQWLSIMHLQIPTWKDSLTLWQHAARFEPNAGIVASYVSRALLGVGRLEEALPYLQKSEGSVRDYANLGYLLDILQKPQESKRILLEGLQKYPDHHALLYILGNIKFDHEQYKEALDFFTQALQDPQNKLSPGRRAIILNRAGLSNTQLGLYKEAELCFREAMKTMNNNALITYHLGLVLFKQNRLAEAKNTFLQALKLNPNFVEAFNMIGAIFYLENNFTEARVWFNRTLEVDPTFEIAKKNIITLENEGH